MEKYKVAIIGANGYAGGVLLRILANHPKIEVKFAVSRSEAGNLVSKVFPNLRKNYPNLKFSAYNLSDLITSDVVFFATPHGFAQSQVKPLLEAGIKVIDLSADFRIKDIDLWEKWYKQKHLSPDLVKQAAYGLVELNREQIKQANLIAVAGCYPTSVQLALAPLLLIKPESLIELNYLVADCKSGVSGAGRGLKVGSLFCEINENFKPYAVSGHRHKPEMEQGLSLLAGDKVNLVFVPHLVPMACGIQASIYAQLKDKFIDTSLEDIHKIFVEQYKDEDFVQVLPIGESVQTMEVKGTNNCVISVARQDNTLIITSAIDNIVKGAAGQAVQCMNLILGLRENLGLEQVAGWP